MYDKSKGVIAVATGYSGGKYTYTKINHDLLQTDTMSSTPNQMQDLDSYTNAKGYLKRTVMEHARSKWECNTCFLTEEQWISICDILEKGFKVKDGKASVSKRHLTARFYNDWKHDYESMHCYVPDITFQYKVALGGKLMYQPVRIAFIEL